MNLTKPSDITSLRDIDINKAISRIEEQFKLHLEQSSTTKLYADEASCNIRIAGCLLNGTRDEIRRRYTGVGWSDVQFDNEYADRPGDTNTCKITFYF